MVMVSKTSPEIKAMPEYQRVLALAQKSDQLQRELSVINREIFDSKSEAASAAKKDNMINRINSRKDGL